MKRKIVLSIIVTITIISIFIFSINFINAKNNSISANVIKINSSINSSNNVSNKTSNSTTSNSVSNSQIPICADIKSIIDKGELVVAIIKDDEPPCVMTDGNGQPYGFDIDLAKNIAQALDVNIRFDRTATSFNDLFEMEALGKCDLVISKFSRTLDRAKSIRFSTPYLNINQALLVNKLELSKNGAEQNPMGYLKGNKVNIGVLQASAYVNYANQLFPKANIIQYAQWTDIINDVKSGKLTAGFYDELEIVRLVRSTPDTLLYAAIYVLTDKKDPIAIGVNGNSGNLLDFVNIYLDNNNVSENVQDFIKKYPEIFSGK